MNKVSLLFAFVLAFGIRAASADCIEVSYVEKPGPNFAVFLEALESDLEDLCPNEPRKSVDIVDFEFGQKKGEFEVIVHHIPEDCPTFGVIGELKCDPWDRPHCYSIGKFTLVPNPEAAKKLAEKIAEKINNGARKEVDCGLDTAD